MALRKLRHSSPKVIPNSQLYLIEHQMAYGMGRPAILREDETIHQCRRLLEHPLSITSDARLVSTVELTALRCESRPTGRPTGLTTAPLHIELTAAPDVPIAESTLRRLKQANADFDAWERYWDRILCRLCGDSTLTTADRFGKSPADFFRESREFLRTTTGAAFSDDSDHPATIR
jgi:hypothetical protein